MVVCSGAVEGGYADAVHSDDIGRCGIGLGGNHQFGERMTEVERYHGCGGRIFHGEGCRTHDVTVCSLFSGEACVLLGLCRGTLLKVLANEGIVGSGEERGGLVVHLNHIVLITQGGMGRSEGHELVVVCLLVPITVGIVHPSIGGILVFGNGCGNGYALENGLYLIALIAGLGGIDLEGGVIELQVADSGHSTCAAVCKGGELYALLRLGLFIAIDIYLPVYQNGDIGAGGNCEDCHDGGYRFLHILSFFFFRLSSISSLSRFSRVSGFLK